MEDYDMAKVKYSIYTILLILWAVIIGNTVMPNNLENDSSVKSSSAQTISGNKEKWNAVIGSLDPATCLDMYVGTPSVPLTYPTSGQNGSCNHVQEWCDLSDKIITNDAWSDEEKVYAMVQYLIENFAYDNYRVVKLNNVSRANKDDAWSDDNHFMFYNHVGQCFDFANALCVMSRHQGIPCTSTENSYHTVNAVWLDGEWVAIDVSAMTKYYCNTEDTSRKFWVNRCGNDFNKYYCYYDGNMDTYNQALATPETMLVGRSGKNPM